MTVRVEVQPSVLEWARKRAGLSDDDLAKGFPKYDQWLSGEVQPTLRQLQSFANKTHAPPGYFFLDEPPDEDVPIPDLRTIGDRGIPTISADLIDTIYICQARQDWYRDHQLLVGADPLAFVGTASLDSPPDAVAAEMRTVFGWSREVRQELTTWTDALARLRENAEQAGVLVMISGIVGANTRRKLRPEEFRGFALADPYAAVVFVNGADSKAAQVFTLAHELAHLWLGTSALSDVEAESVRTIPEERWCNEVAAEFLVPMSEFLEIFDPESEVRPQLEPLAKHFRVSTQVILGQVREAGFMDWPTYLAELEAERHRIAQLVEDRGTGGNFYYTKPVQVGKRFAREVIASTLEGQTLYTDAFRLLQIKKQSTFEELGERLGVT